MQHDLRQVAIEHAAWWVISVTKTTGEPVENCSAWFVRSLIKASRIPLAVTDPTGSPRDASFTWVYDETDIPDIIEAARQRLDAMAALERGST